MTGCGSFWKWGVFVRERLLRAQGSRGFGWRHGGQFRLAVPGWGAGTARALLETARRSHLTWLGRCCFVRSRPRGGRSWSPPQLPNGRRRRSFARSGLVGVRVAGPQRPPLFEIKPGERGRPTSALESRRLTRLYRECRMGRRRRDTFAQNGSLVGHPQRTELSNAR